MREASKWFWNAAFVVSVVFLIARITFVFLSNGDSEHARYVPLITIAIIFSLSVLFILEGLTVSAIHIKDADRDQLRRFLVDSPGTDKGEDILAIFDILISRYNMFVVGRGLLSVIFVVIIAQLIEQLHLRHFIPDHESFGIDEAAENALFPIFSPLSSVLVAALITYWVAQLLPHFMAGGRPVAFMRLPFAKLLTHLSLALSNYGAGAPSLYLLRLMQKAHLFRGEEHLGVGDSQIYEAMVAYFGFGVQMRTINAECSLEETTITDQLIQEYRHGEHSELRHMVSIPKDIRGDDLIRQHPSAKREKWTPEVPSGVAVVDVQPKAVLQRLSVMPTTGGAPDFQAMILECTALLDVPLPRADQGIEKAGLTVAYPVSPLHRDDRLDEFVVEISKPTRRVEVHISPVGIALRQPEVTLHPANELHALGERTIIEHTRQLVERKDGKWIVSIDYPPLGLVVKIVLDARPLIAVSQT